MSFLGVLFTAQGVCRRVKSEWVSGFDDTRARVCDAFFLSLPASTESKSSTSMKLLSFITRTERPGCMISKEIYLYDAIFTKANTHFLNTHVVFFKLTRVTQANEFTIIPVNKFIPALKPCETKDLCYESSQSCMSGTGCKVAVPYSFDSTPWSNIPAVVTDRYAFWITNPSMAMFDAARRYCNGDQGELALVPESSYQSIQVWRFDPYQLCPVGNDGVRICPQDSSARYKLLPGFVYSADDSVCNQTFNVVAPTISYIDESNLAITVLQTVFVNLDCDTLRPIDPSMARYLLARPYTLRKGRVAFFLTLIIIDPFAFYLVLSRVHVDFERLKHLLHVDLHAVVSKDTAVHPVQPLHSWQPSTLKRTDLEDALLKLSLIPTRVCERDFEHIVTVNLHLVLS
jgi:hypothetical protein